MDTRVRVSTFKFQRLERVRKSVVALYLGVCMIRGKINMWYEVVLDIRE